MDTIECIERWFASLCDGTWEHNYGLTVESTDNPGWQATLDKEVDESALNSAMHELGPDVRIVSRDNKIVIWSPSLQKCLDSVALIVERFDSQPPLTD